MRLASSFARIRSLAAPGVMALAICALLAPTPARAGVIYGFTNITNQTSLSGSQFTVEVSDAGSGQVAFTFKNAVGTASNVTEIYFDDGTLLGISSVTQTGGTTTPTFGLL